LPFHKRLDQLFHHRFIVNYENRSHWLRRAKKHRTGCFWIKASHRKIRKTHPREALLGECGDVLHEKTFDSFRKTVSCRLRSSGRSRSLSDNVTFWNH